MRLSAAPSGLRGVRGKGFADQAGFTLIEMSIVLVIIGLIIGGIVKGQEVVNGARLKMQVAQIDAIKGAVFTFQDRYAFLPGDLRASTILGTAAGADGNQNGAIALNTGTASVSVADNQDVSGGTYESSAAWIQLAMTNLLAGMQVQPANTALSAATSVFYPGKAGNSFLWMANFVSPYGPVALMVRLQGGTGVPTPILREQDAYAMDLKFDDGIPGTGSIIVNRTSTTGACTTAAPTANVPGSYTPAQPANQLSCVLNFLIQ